MTQRPRASVLSLLGCGILMVGVLGSCEQAPTDTGTLLEQRRRGVVKLSSPSFTYTSIGTFSIGGVNASGSTTDRSTPGPTLPNKRILYRVTASGTVTASRTAYWNNGPAVPTEDPYGPSGFANGSPTGPTCYAFMYVGSSSFYGGEIWYAPSCLAGTPPFPTTASSHVYLAGATSINRASSTGGGQWDCYVPGLGSGPCFSWTDDGQTVTIERVEATLNVAVSPPDSVNYGDSVTVTASISPGGPLDGREIPWTIDSTRWVPAFGTQWAPCSWNAFVPNNSGPMRICRRPFTRSGTLTVFATVNGTAQSKSVQVFVRPPKLKVTATPSTVLQNAPVTFTITMTPSPTQWWAPTWSWRPDVGTGGLSADCQWNHNPCTRNVSKSGWMKATAVYDGYSLVDSARVVVSNCITNDSILDDARIRDQLRNMWNAMNTTGPPQNRLERYGYRYYDSASQTIRDTTFQPLSGATPCQTWGNGVAPPVLGPRSVIWHGHGFRPYTGTAHTDTLPSNCPPDPNNPPAPGDWRYQAPGPSQNDIDHATNAGAKYIVIDKSNVYRSWGPDIRRASCDILHKI